MNKYEFTLDNLILALNGSVPEKECEKYFRIWDNLRINGEDLVSRLDSHLSERENNFIEIFPSIIAATEEFFHPDFNSHENKTYKHIMPIIVALYDLLLSLRSSYRQKSAISCGMIARAIFEARVNLAEILNNPDVFAPQFTRYKEVARYWNEYRSLDNPTPADQQALSSKLASYPEWYHNEWKEMKKKRDMWTGIPGDTLRQMAIRNGLEDDYKAVYKNTSAFVHISPLLGNYYSVHGKGPLANEKGVFEMTFIGLSNYLEAYVLALKVVGLNADLAHSLNIPLTIMSNDNFSKI